MGEPLILRLTNESAWDASTPVVIHRDQLIRDRNYYRATIASGGVFDPSFFGLLSSATPKLVSMAVDSFSPLDRARVTPGEEPTIYRAHVDLSPRFQTVLLTAEDRLWVGTEGPTVLTLLVNELSEAEMATYAHRELRPQSRTKRLRVVREDESGFQSAVLAPLATEFAYEGESGYLAASTTGDGYLALDEWIDSESEGAYVWVRFTGIGDGEGAVYLVDPRTGESRSLETGLKSPLWSRPIWISRRDRLAFASSPPPVHQHAAVELELSPTRHRRVEV